MSSFFFFFLSARCGQRLLVEYEKSTGRNTGSSIHGGKQQTGKRKADKKTAVTLLNTHKYSRKLLLPLHPSYAQVQT